MALHTYAIPVTFGDCDPAGIVYYPNILRWVDGTFHDWLRQHGGHQQICGRLGSIGVGLMDVQARFRSPLRDGDRLVVSLVGVEWSKRTVTARYAGHVSDRLAFEASEVRGLFVRGAEGITAAPMDALRAIIEGNTPGG